MNKTCVLLFSKDRPLQADLCLRSFFYNCVDFEEFENDIAIKVLLKASDERYLNAYQKLQEDYAGEVNFILEKDFKKDLLDAIDGFDRILFLVDDNIFVGRFYLEKVDELMTLNPDVLAFSFRLGENTTYCYSLNQNQLIPEFIDVFDTPYQATLKYNWTYAQLDFGYALDLSSSYYRTRDIFFLLDRLQYRQPNDLEWVLYLNLYRFNPMVPNLFCFETSVAFCAPMNKVQKVNNNRYVMAMGYMINDLLYQFETGYRVDVKQFDGFIPNSCHCEYFFLGG